MRTSSAEQVLEESRKRGEPPAVLMYTATPSGNQNCFQGEGQRGLLLAGGKWLSRSASSPATVTSCWLQRVRQGGGAAPPLTFTCS